MGPDQEESYMQELWTLSLRQWGTTEGFGQGGGVNNQIYSVFQDYTSFSMQVWRMDDQLKSCCNDFGMA